MFLTHPAENENKRATGRRPEMQHRPTPFFARETTEFAQDMIGALSLCATFVAVLYLPGLF